MVHDKEICPAGDGVLHNAKRCIQSTCDGINDFLSFHDQTYSSFLEFFCEGGGGNFLEQSNRTGQLHTTEIDGEGKKTLDTRCRRSYHTVHARERYSLRQG